MFNITRYLETNSKLLACVLFSLFITACSESGAEAGSGSELSQASSNPETVPEEVENVDPVLISSQPQSITVLEGGEAVFTVGATGGGVLSLQWRKNGSPIVGETNASLVIANADSSAAGQYSVVVTNSVGAVNSLTALLTVQASTGGPVVVEPPVEEPPIEVPVFASIELSWDIPELREDGSDLELYEIDGYMIKYGTDENNLNSSLAVDGASLDSILIDELDAGTYYFAIATVDSDGVQGAYSVQLEQVVL